MEFSQVVSGRRVSRNRTGGRSFGRRFRSRLKVPHNRGRRIHKILRKFRNSIPIPQGSVYGSGSIRSGQSSEQAAQRVQHLWQSKSRTTFQVRRKTRNRWATTSLETIELRKQIFVDSQFIRIRKFRLRKDLKLYFNRSRMIWVFLTKATTFFCSCFLQLKLASMVAISEF